MTDNTKVIFQKQIEGKQLRIEVSEFKEKFYVHFRWWYESYDEGFLPSNEGVSMPVDLEGIKVIVEELTNLLSIKDLEEILVKRKNQRVLR